MPNTLAHYGVQMLPFKLLDQRIDVKWLGLGCIIPDLPWILQRFLWIAAPGLDRLDLRIYCMILASLFFCLLLSAAFAALANQSRKVFLLLAGSSLMHLLLDALQIKWANGVHLMAPLNWQLTRFGLFWPENNVTLLLSTIGLITVLLYGFRDRMKLPSLLLSPGRLLGSSALLLLYFLLPMLLWSGPIKADNHYVQTLGNTDRRMGKQVAFDRCHFDLKTGLLTIFTKEELAVAGRIPARSGTVSLRGHFQDTKTLFIEDLHYHGNFRDGSSLLGLLLLLTLWLDSVRRIWLKKIRRGESTASV